jgi:hypothetical protein
MGNFFVVLLDVLRKMVDEFLTVYLRKPEVGRLAVVSKRFGS